MAFKTLSERVGEIISSRDTQQPHQPEYRNLKPKTVKRKFPGALIKQMRDMKRPGRS